MRFETRLGYLLGKQASYLVKKAGLFDPIKKWLANRAEKNCNNKL
jgi:hypothetical protein